MKRNTSRILLLIFLFFSIVIAWQFWGYKFLNRLIPVKNQETGFNSIKIDSINLIIIQKGQTAIKLTKNNTNWKVQDFPASDTAIKNLLNGFNEADVKNIVSRNPANKDQFGFSDSEKILLAIKGTGFENKYEIGLSGPETNSFYVKKDGSNNIYLASGNIKSALFTSVSDWREKTVINIDAVKINKVEVTGPESFVLSKNKNGKWQIISGGKTNQLEDDKSAAAISAVSDLLAYDFLSKEETDEFNLSKDHRQIIVLDNSGQVLVQLTYLKKDNDYYISNPVKTDLYKVYTTNLSGLFDLTLSE